MGGTAFGVRMLCIEIVTINLWNYRLFFLSFGLSSGSSYLIELKQLSVISTVVRRLCRVVRMRAAFFLFRRPIVRGSIHLGVVCCEIESIESH